MNILQMKVISLKTVIYLNYIKKTNISNSCKLCSSIFPRKLMCFSAHQHWFRMIHGKIFGIDSKIDSNPCSYLNKYIQDSWLLCFWPSTTFSLQSWTPSPWEIWKNSKTYSLDYGLTFASKKNTVLNSFSWLKKKQKSISQ